MINDLEPPLVPMASDEIAISPNTPARERGLVRLALRSLLRDRGAMIALTWLAFVLVLAVFGRWIMPDHPNQFNLGATYQLPGLHHLAGTDEYGRDTLSRLIQGASVALRSSAEIVAIALAVALPIGLVAGYRGGATDYLVMRLMDAILSFPALALALAIVAVLGVGLTHVMIAIAIVLVPGLVRVIRGQTLAISKEGFVDASRAIGTPVGRILLTRILPSLLPSLIVFVSILLGASLLAEAGLSFLGLDVQPPNATWGNMLSEGYQYIFNEPFQMVPPGLMIALTILAFNVLGGGVSDAVLGGNERTGGRLKRGALRRGKLGLTSVASPDGSEGDQAAPLALHHAQKREPLLSVQDLRVEFATREGMVPVLNSMTFDLLSGEVLGLVGESGSGKTVTSLAIMRLISTPPGRISGGRVVFDGVDLLSLPRNQLRDLRGNEVSMIFQDPMSSLNPAYTIGKQIVEAVRLHHQLPKEVATRRAKEVLDLVGLSPAAVFDEYPHRLSGGMCQRVLIAMALVNEPKLLIADEPTTALDVTVQAQILELLRKLRDDNKMSILFITHDFGVAAELCDRIAVVYAGEVVEVASRDDLFVSPGHPYTRALLKAIPSGHGGATLMPISGIAPSPGHWLAGCRFQDRCPVAREDCGAGPVPMIVKGDQTVRCVRFGEAPALLAAEAAIDIQANAQSSNA